MPADRLFHPRAGHSRKVNGLTDFEFRVWWTYQLAADDFGVMRRSAVALQAANDRLAKVSPRVVERALARVIDIGLLAEFEHQGEWFVCQLDWQEFQKVRYPRDTTNPMPSDEVFQKYSDETRELFQMHSGKIREQLTPYARAGGRETANGSPQEAHGERQTANAVRERFDAFWQAYPRKAGKDAAWRAWQKRRPTAEILAVMLAALARQRQSPQWLRDGGQYIPHPSTWLNQGRWQDEESTVPAPLVSPRTQQNIAASEEAERLILENEARRTGTQHGHRG